MKKLLLSIFSLILLNTESIWCQNYGNDSLFVSYSFELDNSDSQGNVNLAFHGNGISIITDAERGNVLSLNSVVGDSSYIESDTNLIPANQENYTVAMWVKNTDVGASWQTFFKFQNSTSGYYYYLSPNLWGNNYGLISNSSGGWNYVCAVPALAYGEWFHLTIAQEGLNVKVYLNGEPYASGVVAGLPSGIAADQFYFGVDPNSNEKTITVLFDEIQIYHQALDSTTIYNKWNNKQVIAKSKRYIYESNNASAWYSFDYDGTDSIGTNLLSLNQVAFVNNSERGRVAVIYHNNKPYMEVPAMISDDDFTVATWFYWDNSYLDYWQAIFEFVNSTNNNNFYLSPRAANNSFSVVSENKDLGTWESIDSGEQLPDSAWVHVALTFSNGAVQLFTNGTLGGEGTLSNSFSEMGIDRLYIGADPLPGREYRYLDAKYDDFAVFDHVLSSDQINALSRDTIISPPDVDPYIFESTDYVYSDWYEGVIEDSSYIAFGGNVQLNQPDTENELLVGLFKGEGTFTVWALVNQNQPVESPFWFKEDDKSWSKSRNITGGSGWRWEKVYQTVALSDGNHFLAISASADSVKVNKFLITADWTYNPENEYSKTDLEQPTVPANLTSKFLTNESVTLTWSASSDNIEVSGYDILSDNKVIAITNQTFVELELQASTELNFTVRARDQQGNVSAKSDVVSITVPDLTITVDMNAQKQTIHHFGSSDAWAVLNIGSWQDAKKEEIAKWLFSRKLDAQGNPEGIGLSMWRIMIGDGSADQANSGYNPDNWFTESDCFLNESGTYNWAKQAGTQWFMAKAKEYGVESFTGWSNSPPYFMTKNGYTFKTNADHTYNLESNRYNEYAEYLAQVAKHFQDEGMPFDVISPINEPQWGWNATIGSASQAGSPASNEEMAGVVKAIDAKFTEHGVNAKIMVSEAGNLEYLYKDKSSNADDQINEFWNTGSANYLGDLGHMGTMVAGHSYSTNSTVSQMATVRSDLADEIETTSNTSGHDLEYWQTEYSILGGDYLEGRDVATLTSIDYSLWLARIIHTDLTIGNATGWSFWTSLSYPKWADHAHRFGLINWAPVTNDETNSDGTYEAHKNLWALGNYSRFIRPGMIRLSIGSEDIQSAINAASKQMVSVYSSTDTLVIVAINYAGNPQNIKVDLTSLHDSLMVGKFKQYVTSESYNLKEITEVNKDGIFNLPAKSISTFVGVIESNPDYVPESVTSNISNSVIKVYPNPVKSYVIIETETSGNGFVEVIDCTGKILGNYKLQGVKTQIDLNRINEGIYFLRINIDGNVTVTKLSVTQ